jgi:hypothetical protein
MSSRPIVLVPLALFAACSVALIAVVAGFAVTVKPTSAASPDYRVVSTGGLEYEAMLGRPLDPQDSVDKDIVAGLPVRERRVPRGDLLFGAFFAVTNPALRSVPSADRIELRDESGHVYQPLRLPAGNPYAYSPRAIPPHTRIPQSGTAADDNLAATGLLLLYRIPSDAYENGVLQLIIHPHGGGSAASLLI